MRGLGFYRQAGWRPGARTGLLRSSLGSLCRAGAIGHLRRLTLSHVGRRVGRGTVSTLSCARRDQALSAWMLGADWRAAGRGAAGDDGPRETQRGLGGTGG